MAKEKRAKELKDKREQQAKELKEKRDAEKQAIQVRAAAAAAAANAAVGASAVAALRGGASGDPAAASAPDLSCHPPAVFAGRGLLIPRAAPAAT